MKKTWISLFACLSFCTVFIPFASAAVAPAVVDEFAAIKAAAQKMLPTSKIDSIRVTTVPSIYEVIIGAEVIYFSKDGRYMFQGDLIDINAKKNLTEDQRAIGRVKLISAVNPSSVITFSPNTRPQHIVTVFTDIDCPYCRKMHEEIASYNRLGIEIRYLAFPRAGVGSDSYNKMVSVFCATDRKAALTLAKANKPITAKTCVNPVDDHMRLVTALGLTGTPSMILKDGSIIPGYVPADRLKAALDERFKI